MLRATVRLGRTAARPDHTSEYAVTLDGEIPFGPDDPEGVREKVAELIHLADEALAREIDRDRECPPAPRTEPAPHRPASPHASRPAGGPGHPEPKSDAATPKQVQYLLNLSKRNGLSRDELDVVIARVTGSPKNQSRPPRPREAGPAVAGRGPGVRDGTSKMMLAAAVFGGQKELDRTRFRDAAGRPSLCLPERCVPGRDRGEDRPLHRLLPGPRPQAGDDPRPAGIRGPSDD